MVIDAQQAIEAIRVLKSRYFRFLDMKDYDGLDSVFTDDAVIDVRGSTTASADEEPSVQGLDDGLMTGRQFKLFFRSGIAQLVTVHHGHMPEITIDSATTATGIWALEDRIWFPKGGPYRLMHGWGHYHESYVKENGRWRICAMRISRLKMHVEPWS